MRHRLKDKNKAETLAGPLSGPVDQCQPGSSLTGLVLGTLTVHGCSSVYLGNSYMSPVTALLKYKSFPAFPHSVSLFSASCTLQGGTCFPMVLWLPHMATVKLDRASLFPCSSVLLILELTNTCQMMNLHIH